MRPIHLLTLALLVPALANAQEKPPLADLNIYGDFLTAEGVWRPDNVTDKTEIALDSVTRIECYRHGGRDLVDSDAYCMQATASVVLGTPNIEVAYYPVLTWNKDKVIAADDSTAPFPVCTWTQITISLHDHSVMATDTRKLDKGHEGVNNVCDLVPLAQTYHLMEKIKELTRRRLRKVEKEKK